MMMAQSEIRVGKPVKIVPDNGRRSFTSKYAAVYRAAINAKGWWVPVRFDMPDDARRFRDRVRPPKGWTVNTRLRGETVYVRMLPKHRTLPNGETH